MCGAGSASKVGGFQFSCADTLLMNDCHRPDIACWSFGGSKKCLNLWQNLHTIWWREGRIIWRGVGWTNGRVGWNDRLGIGAPINLTGLLWPNYWNGRFMPCSTSESGSSSLILVPLRLYWWPENKSSVGAEWKYLYIHLQSLLEPTSMFFFHLTSLWCELTQS